MSKPKTTKTPPKVKPAAWKPTSKPDPNPAASVAAGNAVGEAWHATGHLTVVDLRQEGDVVSLDEREQRAACALANLYKAAYWTRKALAHLAKERAAKGGAA